MKRKSCKVCNEEKLLSEFVSAGSKNGVAYYKNICKECKKSMPKNIYLLNCGRCRKEFESVGNKNRTYCSKECKKIGVGNKISGDNNPFRKSILNGNNFSGVNHHCYGRKLSDETKKKISNSHIGKNGLKGDKNPMWKGGITELYSNLRNELYYWRKESMEFTNYHCDITNEKSEDNLEVHHLIPFHQITDKMLEDLKIERKKFISEYTLVELDLMSIEIKKRHMNLLGVPLNKEVHLLFHKTFGYHNNTPEQYYFFKENYEKIKNCQMTSEDYIGQERNDSNE